MIVNSDPLPGAWLSRYDRTVSQQVVDAVRGRFAAGANPPGLSLTVAGEERTGGAPVVENEGVLSKLLGLERVSGAPLMEGSPSPSPPRQHQQQGWQRVRRRWVHPVGAGAVSSFSGAADSVSLAGSVSTALVGAELRAQRWQAGAALAHSWGNGAWAGEAAAGDGEVSSSLTGLFPYGRYALTPRLGQWAVAGYGWGSLSLDTAGVEYNPAAHLTMAAVAWTACCWMAAPQG